MKVVHVINNLAKGGAEKLLSDVLPFFKSQGIEVSVLLLSKKDSATPYLAHLEANHIEVSWIDEGSVYDARKIFKIRKFLEKNRPDLVHVHLFPAMYWAAFAKLLGPRFPTVFTEHSNQNRRFSNPLFRPVDKWVYRTYNRIIAISPSIADKLKSWTGLPQKIKIIRNGVDTTRFKDAEPYNAPEFLDELRLTPSAITLMMTARFAYPKDHKTIIDALKLLPENFVALFVGEGDGKPHTEAYVKQMGLNERVRFLGFRTDIPRLMKTANFNILSSGYEGMSGVTCEALAAGQAFLGSDVPGINDVVPDHRFLFQAGSAEELAKKVLDIQGDEAAREKMKADSLQQVQQFDITVMVDQTIQLYQQIIAEQGA